MTRVDDAATPTPRAARLKTRPRRNLDARAVVQLVRHTSSVHIFFLAVARKRRGSPPTRGSVRRSAATLTLAEGVRTRTLPHVSISVSATPPRRPPRPSLDPPPRASSPRRTAPPSSVINSPNSHQYRPALRSVARRTAARFAQPDRRVCRRFLPRTGKSPGLTTPEFPVSPVPVPGFPVARPHISSRDARRASFRRRRRRQRLGSIRPRYRRPSTFHVGTDPYPGASAEATLRGRAVDVSALASVSGRACGRASASARGDRRRTTGRRTGERPGGRAPRRAPPLREWRGGQECDSGGATGGGRRTALVPTLVSRATVAGHGPGEASGEKRSC